MKRNSKQTGIAAAIDYNKLSQLIYYKVHFEPTPIDDLTTALSYETIVLVCTKHFGISEDELISKKDKYSYHNHIFTGTLFFFLNVDPKSIGKRVRKQERTVYWSAKILSFYLETWLREYDKNLQPAVKSILLECEQLSGGRIFKNVHPELTPLNKCSNSKIEFKRHLTSPYFSVHEILDIPVKPFSWFNDFVNIEVFSTDGKNQYSIRTATRDADHLLFIMQSYGYRCVSGNEYVTLLSQQTVKINEQTLEKLNSYFGNSDSKEDKCTGCPFRLNKACPIAVQKSGFCIKSKSNIPTVKYRDGERMDFAYSNDINAGGLFTVTEN